MSRIVKATSSIIPAVDTYYYEHSEHDEGYFLNEYGDFDLAKCGKKIEVEVDPNEYFEVEDEYYSANYGNTYDKVDPYSVAVAVMERKYGDVFYGVEFCDGLIPSEYLETVFGANLSSKPIFAKVSLNKLLMNDRPTSFGYVGISVESMPCFNHTMDYNHGWLEYANQLQYRGNDIATLESFTGYGDYVFILKLTDVHSKEDFNRIVNLHKRNFYLASRAIIEEAYGMDNYDRFKIERTNKVILLNLPNESNKDEIKSYVGISKERPKVGYYKVNVLGDVDSSGNYELHEETISVKKYFTMDKKYEIYFVVAEEGEYFIELRK